VTISDSPHSDDDKQMTSVQLQKMRLEIEKLKVEIQSLIGANRWENRVTRYIPVITVLIAVFSFWLGIYQFTKQQQIEMGKLRDEFSFNTTLSEKEFRRKFYERQLETYFELSKIAGRISTTEDSAEIKRQYHDFMELYNGQLNIVQDWQVKRAASLFEKTLKEFVMTQVNRERLQTEARALAEACRGSLRDVWGIPFLANKTD